MVRVNLRLRHTHTLERHPLKIPQKGFGIFQLTLLKTEKFEKAIVM